MSRICAEIGTVIAKKDGGRIAVLIRRTEACEPCEANNICAAFTSGSGDITLVLENTLEAEVGDEVIIELMEVSPGKSSAAMYLVPAVNLILGGIIGIGIAGFFHADKDTAVLFGAGLGFCVGLFVSGRIGTKTPTNPQYVPVLMEITLAMTCLDIRASSCIFAAPVELLL
jgi:sigma-E factor negative regulatory protein RseC